MKKLVVLALVVATALIVLSILASSVVSAEPTDKKLPQFVISELSSFNSADVNRHRAAFARPFAWGTGNYHVGGKDIGFYWFAYTNSDAYFQVRMNTQISGDDVKKVNAVKDIIDRNYDTALMKDYTWIGLSNDYVFDDKGMTFCREVGRDYECDDKSILEYYIGKLTSVVPSLTFKVRGMLK